MMTFDRPTLARFKERYARAVDDNDDMFVFDDKQFHTPYAKYLIEYVESQL